MIGLAIEWMVEVLKGIGRFFLHPLFYCLIGLALYIGYVRMKRERKDFHIRIFDMFHEVRGLISSGLVLSLLLSITTIVVGVVLPFWTVVLIGLFTVLLAVFSRGRLVKPSFFIGLAFFTIILASGFTSPYQLIEGMLSDFRETSLPAVALLLSILILSEGWLILRKGHIDTSPVLINSKRGLKTGAHFSEKLWMLPVFLLLPGEILTTAFSWWPVFSIGEGNYTLFLVPFGIGFSQKIKSMLPNMATAFIGKRVLLLGTAILLLSVASIWYPVIAIMSVAFAMVARELISLQFRIYDDSQTFLFTKKENGLLILGIIPKSPAHKMGLQVGEVITKVNGTMVQNVGDFYQTLQKNSAFCKLEVKGLNGEVRFVQRALYEGEHHELGIIFVSPEKKWTTEAV